MKPADSLVNIVWVDEYPGDLNPLLARANDLLANSKLLNSGLERDGGTSSSSDPDAIHAWSESSEFIKWISHNINKVWDNWQLPPNPEFYFNSSWVNLHPPGAWTDWHSHKNVDLVVVLYLDQPENGGHLEILNPLADLFGLQSGTSTVTIPVKTGTTLFFPGWLYHRSGINNSNNSRVVASFNLYVRWR